MSTTTINWDTEAKMLGADPTATLALDRSAWERLGAIFTEVDDGNGETPGLATATVRVADTPVQFGVLDYSDEDTYLLLSLSLILGLVPTASMTGDTQLRTAYRR
jgi:hypothetical protein